MEHIKRLEKAINYAMHNYQKVYQHTIDVKKRIDSAKNLCIFGVGEFFQDCADLEHIREFQYVSDNNPDNWGKYFKGKKCIPPNELSKMKDIVVIIMVGEYRPIIRQLKKLGIECYSADEFYLLVYDNNYDNQWFNKHKEKMLAAINVFADDFSKEVYLEAVINRIAPHLSKKIFNEIKIAGEYFEHDVFQLTKNEAFVDCGAYTGDSLQKFIKVTEDKFDAIYSFEVDNNNFKNLEQRIASLKNKDRISIFHMGVSNKNEATKVSGIGVSANIDKNGVNSIKLCRLDDVLKNKRVSYIKMDVETAEIDALEGAQILIKEQKPKLGISAYHLLNHLWDVPLYIYELRNDYKIYMRHHAPVVWDTDCYAY